MSKFKILLRIILALLVCPVLLLVVKHRKFWIFFWIVLSGLFLLFFLSCVYNWFFSESGIRKLYYLQTYKKADIRVIEDNDFHFYEQDYSKNYIFNSNYYVSHRILLIPESKTVPVQYEFQGELSVEIYYEGVLLYSFVSDKQINLLREGTNDHFENYYVYRGKNSSKSTSVFAFELGKIPFSLIRFKRSGMQNMEIKITILKPEIKLRDYCNRATLIIIPDLEL